MTNLDKAKNLLLNVFKTKEAAEQAYDSLLHKGYLKEDIYMIMSDDTKNKYFPKEDLPKHSLADAKGGAKTGGAVGGALGALAAAALAIGSTFVIPGLNITISGPIAAAFAGAGAGGVAGGLIGGFIKHGISEAKAKELAEEVKAGNIVVGVKTKTDEDYRELEEAWKNL